MQRDLPKVLKVILDSPKVEQMQLVSNATLIPKPEVMSLLKNPKASIHFSDYGDKLCPKRKMIVDKCLSEGVMVRVDPYIDWIDYGDTSVRTSDINKVKSIYKKCTNICKHIWNGELHVCPRSAHGKALDMIKMKEGDYVRLLETTVEERRMQIRALYDIDYVDACACCGIIGGQRIKAGLQGETIKYKMVTQ